MGDNFPEGLFPPGLLTQDDINEIRKQQEKQAKEAEEKERQQQQQQQQPDQSGQGGQADYEDNGGDDSNGAGTGEEAPTDGTGAVGEGEGDGAAEGAAAGGEAGADDAAAVDGATQGHDAQLNSGGLGGNAIAPVSPVQQGYSPAAYGNANAYNPLNQNMQTPPAAYKNTYQPIQPQLQPMMNHQRVPLQPSIEYANGNYPNSAMPHAQSPMGVNQMNNQPFGGYQPGGKRITVSFVV